MKKNLGVKNWMFPMRSRGIRHDGRHAGRREKEFARNVVSGGFDIAALSGMTDAEAISALSPPKGIGVWTAEMLLLFSLGRSDILSFGDLAFSAA